MSLAVVGRDAPGITLLVPTCNRSSALAATLTALAFQQCRDFRVVIADQSDAAVERDDTLAAVVRVLAAHGIDVAIHRNLPRLGLAQQREFLLEQADGRYCLFIDDDVILEPWVLGMLRDVLDTQGCGFAGNAVIGLSYKDDVRPHEQEVERITGRVEPECVTPGTPAWQRHRLHNAANLLHVQQALAAIPEQPVLYKVAWVGGCVMYRTEYLRAVGGFGFWKELPLAHCGEDVLAQLRVAAGYGGCGVMPSGAYHQELETSVPDRHVNAPEILGVPEERSLRG